ncbi:MAG TPA: signal peptidase II [Caulobacteraceae bacterium]|jgi:signal peptidase II
MSLISRSGAVALSLAAAVAAVDQETKSWVLGGLRLFPGESLQVWGPLRLTLVENNGVSFGLFQSDASWTRWALAAFSLSIAIALAIWVRQAQRVYTGLALGLIIGGALGNFLDRVRAGQVIDFLDVRAMHFPWIFNVADSAITVGVILLLAEGLIPARKATPKPLS